MMPPGYDNWKTSGRPRSDGTCCPACGSEDVEVDDDGIYGYDIMCNAAGCGERTSVGCDGFVYEGETCGLVGTQKRPVDIEPHECERLHPGYPCRGIVSAPRGGKTRAAMDAMDRMVHGGKTVRIEQPDWKSCIRCGKTGSHEHSAMPGRNAAKESPTRRTTEDVLDETIDLAIRRRRKWLLEDYDFGTIEMRIIAKMMGLTDEQLDTLGQKILEAYPGIKRFAATHVVHETIAFDVETGEADED